MESDIYKLLLAEIRERERSASLGLLHDDVLLLSDACVCSM